MRTVVRGVASEDSWIEHTLRLLRHNDEFLLNKALAS